MDIGSKIKKVRLAKGLTQKEVTASIDMDPSQYSKIEKSKTDPSISTLDKISKALGITLSELFSADDIFKQANSADKTIMEKLRLIEKLDSDEKESIYHIIDGLFAKKKLKDTLTNTLGVAS